MAFPEASIQELAADGDWWIAQTKPTLERGALVQCWVPHADQVPYVFEPIGRTDATQHDRARVKVAPLKLDQPLKELSLPVAAMPNHPNEVWAAYRAKRRPCLVLTNEHPAVERKLTAGKPKHATAAMMLVAPYFGVASSANRAGYTPEFVDRVLNCFYPQFLVDWLPHPGGEQSILRLDQLQPMGRHHHAYKPTGFRLSDSGLEIMDGWLEWLFRGSIPAEHILATTVQLLQDS